MHLCSSHKPTLTESTAYHFLVWRCRPNSTSILWLRKRIRLVQQAYWNAKEAARSLHPHSTRPHPSSQSDTVLLPSSTANWRRWSEGRSTSPPLNITTCYTNCCNRLAGNIASRANRVAPSRAPASAEVTAGASTNARPARTALTIGAKNLSDNGSPRAF